MGCYDRRKPSRSAFSPSRPQLASTRFLVHPPPSHFSSSLIHAPQPLAMDTGTALVLITAVLTTRICFDAVRKQGYRPDPAVVVTFLSKS